MKTRLSVMLAAALLSIYVFAQSEPYALGNFDHVVSQPAPGGDTHDGGPQAVSDIQSVAGVPLVCLNNGVMMPCFGLGTQEQSMEGASQRQQLNETVRGDAWRSFRIGYGNYSFWNFQDYTYDHEYTPATTENISGSCASGIPYDLQGRPVRDGYKGI